VNGESKPTLLYRRRTQKGAYGMRWDHLAEVWSSIEVKNQDGLETVYSPIARQDLENCSSMSG
jgi:hypothetical protein